MTNDLDTLLERVKAATGPDRELDADLEVVLLGGEIQWKQANYTMEMYPAVRRPSANHVGGHEHEQVPVFTASVDAALALVERCLPGCKAGFEPLLGGEFFGKIIRISPQMSQLVGVSRGPTAPLAILCALLSALPAPPEKPHGE